MPPRPVHFNFFHFPRFLHFSRFFKKKSAETKKNVPADFSTGTPKLLIIMKKSFIVYGDAKPRARLCQVLRASQTPKAQEQRKRKD